MKRKYTKSFTRRIDSKIYDFYRKSDNEISICFTDVLEIFKKQDNRCYLTGDVIDLIDTSSWHLDHVVPTSRNGNSSLDNLAIATKKANLSKNNMLLDEYLEHCQQVLDYHNKK